MEAPAAPAALSATFAFGIVLQAAMAAILLYAKGHGKSIFRDGQRLVLITFLAGAALWAQADFAATLLSPGATNACQIVVTFVAIFDQLARYSIEQFILWGIHNKAKGGPAILIPQIVLLLRFVLGAVFVGFTRQQFRPVCVPRTSQLGIGIAVPILDGLIIVMLAARAFSVGLVSLVRENRSDNRRSKYILLTIVGFTIWTATSVTMLLGMDTMDYMLRATVPAVGLSLLIIIVTNGNLVLILARERAARPPESPKIETRHIKISRDITSSDSSNYPPSRYEDLKGINAFVRPSDVPNTDFRSDDGAWPFTGQVYPPMVATVNTVSPAARSQKQKRGFLHISNRFSPSATVGKLSISNPVLQDADGENPLTKIATVDLDTAAKAEKERRLEQLQAQRVVQLEMAMPGAAQADLTRSSSLIAKRPAPKPPSMHPEEAMKRAVSLKRKSVKSTAGSPRGTSSHTSVEPSVPSPSTLPVPSASTTGAQLSPNGEEMRRRSPRQPAQEYQVSRPMSSPRPPSPPPRSPLRSVAQRPVTQLPSPPRSDFSATEQAMVQPMTSIEGVVRSATPPQFQKTPSTRTSVRPSRQLPASPQESVPEFPKPDLKRTMSQFPKAPVRTRSAPREVVPTGSPEELARTPAGLPRQSPSSSNEPVLQPTKTPLLRRPTIGLPGNPRAQGMRMIAKETGGQRQETVMFVNNIVYNDPNAVEDIMNGASVHKHLETSRTALKSSKSVVHRPRPIPRQLEKDRAIFPAENSPHHRRTKSGGSIASRKSILQSNPGSPTKLPPLPPPPKSAGNPGRPQPNNTKSMTFEEKMTKFFPSPSGTAANKRKMPFIPGPPPPVPDNFMDLDSPSMTTVTSQRQSRKTERSIRSPVLLPSTINTAVTERVQAQSVANISSNIADEVGNSWLPGLAPENHRANGRLSNDRKRASSPVIPADSSPMASEFTDDMSRPRDDETTAWGSVHSPAAAYNYQRARAIAVGEGLAPPPRRDTLASIRSSLALGQDNGEVMTVMLDTAGLASRDTRQLWLLDEHETHPPVPTQHRSQWHHRIGEECPTFSARKGDTRSRKMPPPTPLLLNQMAESKQATLVRAAEPSPLESPEQALQAIQAQLKKLDQRDRDSVESEGRRLELLENLEAEMAGQETAWHALQTGLDRNSMSSVVTSPVIDSRHNSVVAPTLNTISRENSAQSIPSQRRASRRARLSTGKLSERSSRSASPEHSRAPLWQLRLAEAQMEYLDNVPDKLAKKNVNFLSATQAAQLGSPTPPDSDASDNEEGIDAILAPRPNAHVREALWQPPTPQGIALSSTLLWAPATKPQRAKQEAELPGLSIRPAQRKESEPLSILSSSLWAKPQTPKRAPSVSGLWAWRASPPEAAQQPPTTPQTPSASASISGTATAGDRKAARPVAQRPPRRSRRVTLLPDILESPEPLPNKRGTLGIFQFPWGERTDNATTYLPSRNTMYMAMPGTMTTGGPSVNSALERRAAQFESQEYSSSFFDDYDDEEAANSSEGEDEDEDEDEEDSGDDFDETTLWEIASLLRSDQVPSKTSLFPPQYQSDNYVIDDYLDEVNAVTSDYEDELDDEFTEDSEYSISVALEEEEKPLEFVKTLWIPPKKHIAVRSAGSLPQPDDEAWLERYAPIKETLRAKPRPAVPATIESTTLWHPSVKVPEPLTTGPLWTSKRPKSEGIKGLWMPAKSTIQARDVGQLSQPNSKVWLKTYAPMADTLRAKPRAVVPATIESAMLWQLSGQKSQPARSSLMWTSTKEIESAQAPSMTPSSQSPGRNIDQVPQSSEETWWDRNTPAKEVVSAKSPASQVGAGGRSIWQVMAQKVDAVRPGFKWKSKEKAVSNLQSSQSVPELKKVEATPVQPEEALQNSALPKASVPKPSLMWNAPIMHKDVEHEGLFQAGLKRRNFRATDATPAALNMVRPPRKERKDPAKLSSNALWTQTVKHTPSVNWIVARSETPSLLWTAAIVRKEAEHHGMYQPGSSRVNYRTTDSAPAAINMERQPRKETKPLAKLESSALWQRAAKQSPSINWIAACSHTSSAMWSAPRTVKTAESTGLFQPGALRLEFRTTTQGPAALLMGRKPRKEVKPVDELCSSSLWTRTVKPTVSVNWIIAQSQTGSLLWTAPRLVKEVEVKSMFVPGSGRVEFRTTSEAPAAINMVRKPRKEVKALDKISSQSLWVREVKQTVPVHWITARPQNRSMWTAPSVAKEVEPEGLFTPNSGRREFRTTTEMPAAINMDRKPRKEVKPLQQLTSANLWSAAPAIKIEKHWISAKALPATQTHMPVHSGTERPPANSKAIRHTYRPTPAIRADWDAALAEAVAASYPLRRKTATAADWAAALAEAVSQSTLATTTTQANPASPSATATASFDPATSHPVFATPSLITTSEWFHPAATGYTYDPARVHPVFFGSLDVSTCPLEAVHPAMTAYAARKLRRRARSKGSSSSTSPSPSSFSPSSSTAATTPERRGSLGRSRSASRGDREGRRAQILAQIEALEQERLFADRWARQAHSH